MKIRLVRECVAAFLLSSAALMAQNNRASFGQDQGATRFSKLIQINTSNLGTLTRAWRLHTGATTVQDEMTPAVIDSAMYISGCARAFDTGY